MDNQSLAKKNYNPNHKLREARVQRGWSHKNVADQIDLPDSHTVGRWERGAIFPGPHYRQELSRIFGKSVEELGLVRSGAHSDIAQEVEEFAEEHDTLPTFFTSFVGREQEVLAVSTLLMRPDVHLVTLYGTGGVGKTRLGIEVAMQVRDKFVDGVYFVSLAPLDDAASVLPAIATVLDIQERTGGSLEQQVKTALRKKRLLLLLDNCEHVIGAVSFLEALLGACPGVKVLVTSRQVLQLQAEHAFVVPSLSLPAPRQVISISDIAQYTALVLLIQRVQLYQPTFKLTQSNIQVAVDLCRFLDGLPLAIELAAARIKLFSLQTLFTRLAQDWHLLKSELRTVAERHRTLYYTVQWSYNLLNEQEQWFFRRFSVFVGGASLEAIEATLGTGDQPASVLLEIVTSLLDKSLLQRGEQSDGEPRFTMLGTIRSYALECLQEQREAQAMQEAHAGYYATLMEQAAPFLKNAKQGIWLKKLDYELENLRTALHWLIERQETKLALYFCEGFGKFCGLRGYWQEEKQLLKTVLALPHQEQWRAIRGNVLRRAGHLAYRLRELKEAQNLLAESVACSSEVGDLENLAGALSGLGWLLYRQHEYDAADRMLHRCVEVAYQSGNQWVIANALERLGEWNRYEGKLDEAHTLLEQSITIARTSLDTESLARFLVTQVTLEVALGKMARASELAQESLLLAQELGNKPLIALTFDRLGEVVFLQEDYEQAKEYFEERVAIAEELGDTPAMAGRKLVLADIALMEGDLQAAQHLLDEARALLPREDASNDALVDCISGDVKRATGDRAGARQLYRSALLRCKTSSDKRYLSRCLASLAQILCIQGEFEDSAYFLGAANAYLKPRDFHVKQRADFEAVKKSLSAQLSEEKFLAIWQQGAGASFEQVLARLP